MVDRECKNIHASAPEIDPGVFALDGFLTEEEEAKILESLGDTLEPEESPLEDSSDSHMQSATRGLETALLEAVRVFRGPSSAHSRVQ